MKKLIIALVCVGLLVALTIPSIYSASKWGTYTLKFSENVTGTLLQCSANRRFISSSSILRPTLTLTDIFDTSSKKYSGEHEGQCLDLTKHKTEISMQFFFFDPVTSKKVILKVDGGELDGVWLASSFTIKFEEVDAVITTPKVKGKKDPPLLYEDVNITIQCEKE